LPNDSINVSTIDNDINPAEGYLEDDEPKVELLPTGAAAGPLVEANLGEEDPNAPDMTEAEEAEIAYSPAEVDVVENDPNAPSEGEMESVDNVENFLEAATED